MERALVIVEGKTPDADLFGRIAEVLGLDLQVKAVRSNVYNLYNKLREQDFAIDIRDVLSEMTDDPELKTALKADYRYFFLVYDCDIQDTRFTDRDAPPPIAERARANIPELREMLRQLDDEEDETKGKLFINYPMVESYCDCDSFFENEYRETTVELSLLDRKDAYKKRVRHRLVAQKELDAWTAGDVFSLMRMNAAKAYSLVTGRWQVPGYADYDRACGDESLLSAQERLVAERGGLAVLNTSVLFPIYRYGQNKGVYAHVAEQSAEPIVTVLIVSRGDDDAQVEKTLESLHAQKMPRWNHRIVRRDDLPTFAFDDEVCDWVVWVCAGETVQGGALTSVKGLLELCPEAVLCTFDVCAPFRAAADGRRDWAGVAVLTQLHPQKAAALSPLPLFRTLQRRRLVTRPLDRWLDSSVGDILPRIDFGHGEALITAHSMVAPHYRRGWTSRPSSVPVGCI